MRNGAEPGWLSARKCGRSRVRTCGQEIKSLLLYQLSYAPRKSGALYIAKLDWGQARAWRKGWDRGGCEQRWPELLGAFTRGQ